MLSRRSSLGLRLEVRCEPVVRGLPGAEARTLREFFPGGALQKIARRVALERKEVKRRVADLIGTLHQRHGFVVLTDEKIALSQVGRPSLFVLAPRLHDPPRLLTIAAQAGCLLRASLVLSSLLSLIK